MIFKSILNNIIQNTFMFLKFKILMNFNFNELVYDKRIQNKLNESLKVTNYKINL